MNDHTKTHPVALPEKVALAMLFWNSPDDSVHSPETVEAAINVSQGSLQALRIHGGGPAFFKRRRFIWYAKRDVKNWIETDGAKSSTSDKDEQ